MPEGRVAEMWRWPVKSMGGEEVRSFRLDERGVGGDRTHAVIHHHKGEWKPLTAREAPRLLAWHASYPFAPDAGLRPDDPPHAQVTGPDGRSWRWGDPRLRNALAEDLGRDVRLRRDLAGIQDLERSVLVTTEATRAALADELGTPIDLRRFRTNVHLELDAEPWAEHGWEGGTLRLSGGVVLRLLHACVRCAIPTRDPVTTAKWPELLRHLDARHETLFGINARVVQSGRIAVGETAATEPPVSRR
ncbi:MAG: MOSC N-terminal beta barrel domain-containing protein [Solirubrobacteraceae bacterium]